ncbi:hypothetical protein B0H14DRAFT_3440485 [Mycena olivaceomarginata]|nr:hypothetical protein B0H14DRAFT_3440485 [Mycena olivaceomarginata]
MSVGGKRHSQDPIVGYSRPKVSPSPERHGQGTEYSEARPIISTNGFEFPPPTFENFVEDLWTCPPPKDQPKPDGPYRAVLTRADQLWDTGSTVAYSYLGGTKNQQDKVDKVLLEWFEFISQACLSLTQPLLLRLPYANLNFAREDKAVILHEFGHVLGLLQEHQSPARGGRLTLDETAIIDVYDNTDVSNYSALDLKSIMMYFMPAAMNKQRIEVATNYELSDLEKAYMMINYPHNPPHPTALKLVVTLDHALKVAGVSESTAEDILPAQDDPATIRTLFNRISGVSTPPGETLRSGRKSLVTLVAYSVLNFVPLRNTIQLGGICPNILSIALSKTST